MAFEMDGSLLFGFATSLLLTVFAIGVGWIGRFRGAPLWFMMFEGGFGLCAASSNLHEAWTVGLEWYEEPVWAVWTFSLPTFLFALVSATGLGLLLYRFPKQIKGFGIQRAWVLIPVIAVLAAFFWELADDVANAPVPIPATTYWHLALHSNSLHALRGLMWVGALVLALRHRSATSSQERGQIALMAGAISLYPGAYITWGWIDDYQNDGLPAGAMFVAMIVSVAMATVAWLLRTTGQGGTGARNVVFAVLAAPLLGMAFAATTEDASPSGIARITAILLLGFAVLRYKLLGIELKIRWAISKSTIAAVFITVFFVASEVAQQFFGDRLGGTYVGIAAAGMLVFAMAPLQRAAERLAEKAVPVAAAPTNNASTDREESFVAAVRMALKDGNVTKSEERALLVLADQLGIRPARAFELRDQAELVGKRGAV